MKKILKIFIAILTVHYSLSSYHPVYAQISNTAAPTFASKEGLAMLIATLWKTAFMLGGVATLLYLVMGGFTWVTASGDKANSEKAKSMITDAVIGLIVMALSFAIITFIGSVLQIDILNPKFPNYVENPNL